jgi:hypothetical protein
LEDAFFFCLARWYPPLRRRPADPAYRLTTAQDTSNMTRAEKMEMLSRVMESSGFDNSVLLSKVADRLAT